MSDVIDLEKDIEIDPVIEKKVGLILKEAREAKNISPDTIKNELKMRPRLLSALEDGVYAELPDVTTVAALVKSYANYLELDGTFLSQDYRIEMQGLEKKVEIDFPEMLPSTFKISRMAVLLSFIFIVIVALVGWAHYMRQDPFITQDNWTGLLNDPVLETLEQDIAIPVTEEKLYSTAYDFPAPINKVEIDLPQNMQLVAVTEASWIEIKNKNKSVIFSALLNKGQSYDIPTQEGLVMKTGNGGALRLKVGEVLHDIFPEKTRIIKNFSLDRENLEKIVKK